MHLERNVVATLPQVYTVDFLYLGGKAFISAGSEGEHPLYLIDPDDLTKTRISDGPGGTMSLMPIPGKDNELVSVMGLFPPFIGQKAGIFLHSLKSGQWHTKKVIDLPFAHRCEIMSYKGINYLFLASVSKFKKDPEDWSLPGELYIIPLTDLHKAESLFNPFIDNITRNHGMIKTLLNRTEAICISGAEGILAILPDENSMWKVTRLFDKEVSEFALFDIDNDGINELITIEPFHGDTLNIYDKTSTGWSQCYQSELSFGHGLSVGLFNKNPLVAVGSRRGDRALSLYSINNLNRGGISRSIIEEDAGPTQTRIFNYKSKDYILSSNQAKDEVTLYN